MKNLINIDEVEIEEGFELYEFKRRSQKARKSRLRGGDKKNPPPSNDGQFDKGPNMDDSG